MAEESPKIAASPLHDPALHEAEENESKSSSAMFVTPNPDEEGESKDDGPEKTAAVEPKEDQTEKTAAVEAEEDQTEKTAAESKEDQTEKTAAVESKKDQSEKTAPVEDQDLPAASGAASPEAEVPAPAMPPKDEEPGFWAALDEQETKGSRKRSVIRFKLELTRKRQIELPRKRQIDLPLQLLMLISLSRAPLRSQKVVLLLSMPLVPLNLWHQLWQMPKKSQRANLMKKKCWWPGKSYVRQGLCVNIYCDLYYMRRPKAGIRLQARGKLGDGGQWNPKDWYKSGNFSKVEDQLLRNEWKDQIHQLKGLPAPMEEENAPKRVDEIFGKEPIVIEDLETGEVQAHGEVIDKSPMDAPVEKMPLANPMSQPPSMSQPSSMAQALKSSSFKVRNKGLKRLRSLAGRIEEKKRKGEWHRPDVPVPGFARPFLEDSFG